MNIPECVICGQPAAFPKAVKVPYTCITCQRAEQPKPPATGEAKAVVSSDMVLREHVRAAIEAEEELDGEMPDHVYARLLISKRAAAEVLRAAVRATKQGIKTRLGL